MLAALGNVTACSQLFERMFSARRQSDAILGRVGAHSIYERPIPERHRPLQTGPVNHGMVEIPAGTTTLGLSRHDDHFGLSHGGRVAPRRLRQPGWSGKTLSMGQ